MTTSSTSNINIVIKEDGSRVVKRNLDDLGDSASGADKAVESLKGALEAVAAAEGVRALVEMVNQYQELHNQLLFVTTGQGNLNAVFAKLTDVAEATHTSVASNVAEYSALTQATHDLGLSQAQVIAFQTRLNEAVGLSGAGSKDAAGAVDLLAKSLATGRLEGGGFARTLQQVPVIGDILAKTLGVTRGQLKDMADQGELSAKQLVDAFAKAGPQLDASFKGLAPTISETFGELKDAITNAVGTFSDATGAGNTLAEGLKTLAGYVKEGTPYVIQFANALTGTLSPSDQLSTGMKVFATVIITLIGALVLLGKILYTSIVGGFQAVGNVIGGLGTAISAWAEGVIESFQAVVEGVASIPTAIKQASTGDFAAAGKTIADAFSKPWDEATKSFDRSSQTLDATFDDLADNVGKNLSDQFDNLVTVGRSTWDKLDKIWDEGARDLQKKGAPVGQINTNTSKDTTTQFSAQEIAATRKALADLLAQFEPIGAAVLKFQDAEKLLAKAQREGIITKQQEATYIDELKKHYVDILDPVGAYSRKIDEQTGLLKFSADQREIESKLLEQVQTWQKQGVPITTVEIQSLRDKLKAQQDLNKVVTQQDALLADSVQKRQAFTTQLTAIQNLLSDPKSGFKKTDATNALAGANQDLFAGTKEQLDAQQQAFQQMYAQIDQMRQKDLISEQTAQQMKNKVALQINDQRLQNEDKFFGNLATLSHSSNREVAAIGKAAAVAQATIDGIAAVQKALASAPPPVNFALAAAVGVATAANIANIAGIGFATGGSFNVGGSGGTDSQMVAFRATPGEHVAISTPQQLRQGSGGGQQSGQAPAPQVTVTPQIINVRDPSEIPSAMQSADGEKAILNVISNNASAVKGFLGS